jgi:hypothetical protein
VGSRIIDVEDFGNGFLCSTMSIPHPRLRLYSPRNLVFAVQADIILERAGRGKRKKIKHLPLCESSLKLIWKRKT